MRLLRSIKCCGIHFLLFSAMLITSIPISAIPACPLPETVYNPDGSPVTVQINGDEFFNWTTTADGYTVVKRDDGYYTFATLENDELKASQIIARDQNLRSSADWTFLNNIDKNIIPRNLSAQIEKRLKFKQQVVANKASKINSENFKGLVILVEYNDCKFVREDAHTIFSEMINKADYEGYMTTNIFSTLEPYTGSVRDYFYDNSFKVFDPVFDVVGPVTIDYSQYDINQTSAAQSIVKAVCRAVDDEVNFADYDINGDKTVDMVYFIFAGGGSNFSGNDSRLVWPHASTFMSFSLDGVTFGRYACSTELYGKPDSKIIDGIGTVVHEFSHILGLVDEYDTDYASTNGQSIHPAKWSVMASGSYLNKSRTPVGYSYFERIQSGFAVINEINEAGQYTLKPISESNMGYKIKSSAKDEYFLLENRQSSKWDEYLPGFGMLVFRVDSTNVSAWETNKVNCDPNHNYYELVRATPKASSSGQVTDSAGDPFPGSGNVTSLTNETSPSIRSWAKLATEIILTEITETEEGNIEITASIDDIPSAIEDFEIIEAFSVDTTNVSGRFCLWNFESAYVEEPDSTLCNGTRAVGIVKKGQLTSSKFDKILQQISFTVVNPTSSMAIFRCSYSTNDGKNWVSMKDVNGLENVVVSSGTTVFPIYNLAVDEQVQIRISEFSGNASQKCYIDDVIFRFKKSSSVDATFVADNSTISVARDGNSVTLTGIDSDVVAVYNIQGALVASHNVTDGFAQLILPHKGVYFIVSENKCVKIMY